MPQSMSGTFQETQHSGVPAVANQTSQLSETGSDRGTAGFFEGRHFADWSQDVRPLERAGDMEAAEILLHKIADATEAESAATGQGVAPYAYERLAVIARKRRDIEAETAILERFARQKHARGAMPPRLLARLEEIRQLPSSMPKRLPSSTLQRSRPRLTPSRPVWLSQMAGNVLFVDVETTGLGGQDRVVSIACILLRTASLAEGPVDYRYLHLICDPGCNSHPEAAAVHGYSDWLLRHQETFAEIAPQVHSFIAECDVIAAHNARFDLSFIDAELAAAGLPPIDKPRFCTMERYSASYPGKRSLDAVTARIGLSRAGPRHGALEDAWLAMMVYLWLHNCPHRIPFSAFDNPQPSNMRSTPRVPWRMLLPRKQVPPLKAPRPVRY